MTGCGKGTEEMGGLGGGPTGGPTGVLRIKVEHEDSVCPKEDERDPEDGES